jgi:thymidylate kinase
VSIEAQRSSQLVIFEGPDASGKTTIAKWLADKAGASYLSSVPAELTPLRAVADDLPPEDTFYFYATANAITYTRLFRILTSSRVVLDRSHISTICYHSVELGRPLDDYARRIEAFAALSPPPFVVFVTAEATARKRRIEVTRQENKWFRISLRPELNDAYRKAFERLRWPIFEIDTTEMSIDQARAATVTQLRRVWPTVNVPRS